MKRLISVVLLAALAACTTVGPITAPREYISTKQPRSVWLTQKNRSVVKVDGPRMIGDTVVGSVQGEYTEIPLSNVTRVSALEHSTGKTVAAVAIGSAAVVGSLVYLFSHSGSGSGLAIPPSDTLTL